MKRPTRRALLDPRDPEHYNPGDDDDDVDPPEPYDDPTHLGPPDYEGTGRYHYDY